VPRPEFAFEKTGHYATFRIIINYVPIFHVVFGGALGFPETPGMCIFPADVLKDVVNYLGAQSFISRRLNLTPIYATFCNSVI